MILPIVPIKLRVIGSVYGRASLSTIRYIAIARPTHRENANILLFKRDVFISLIENIPRIIIPMPIHPMKEIVSLRNIVPKRGIMSKLLPRIIG